MENEITVFESIKEPMALGEIFAKSGMFPDIKTQAQACVKILAGRELGISPIEAMTNIYIVNNKIALTTKLMGALFKKNKGYDYTLEVLTDTECIIAFYKIEQDKKTELGKSSFTIKDAAKAGLVNKDNWKSYPRNMLFARALSNGIRWYAPETSCGYDYEEIEDVPFTPVKQTIELTVDGEVKNG